MTKIFSANGLLLCAKYALPPNQLKYCGGNQPAEIAAYSKQQSADAGLLKLMEEFSTMLPYLRIIALANQIADPFDYRVVEAYWLGNELLEKVTAKDFYDFLIDDLKLKRKLPAKIFNSTISKVSYQAKPHHSWHVFNIFISSDQATLKNTLATIDACRIGWGQVKKIDGTELTVASRPLCQKNNKLILGEAVDKKINFIGQPNLKKGDYITFHWHHFCDKINLQQLRNLEFYTAYNLRLANLTI